MSKNNYNQSKIDEYIQFRRIKDIAENTIKGDITPLVELIRFTKNKRFDKVTEKDTQEFIGSLKSIGTKTQYATRLISFYKWLFKLDKKQRPDILKWYDYPKKDLILKRKDPDIKNQLITDLEYQRIIRYCGDEKQWGALFETMYLSGGRPDEINNMNIGDVIINDNNKVEILIKKSKKIPRKVPLPETPKMLLRWLGYHPLKDQKDTPLFISNAHRNFHKRMLTCSINKKFDTIKKYTDIKKTLSPHCFRKTRATIMFSARSKDGGILYDDKEIGEFFGWKPHTVSDRRLQYDLRNYEDLKEKIQGKQKGEIETFDILKKEKETLIKKHDKEINELINRIKNLEKYVDTLEMMKDKFEKELSTTKNKGTKKEETIQPAFYDDIVQDVLMRLEKQNIDVKKIKKDKKKKKS